MSAVGLPPFLALPLTLVFGASTTAGFGASVAVAGEAAGLPAQYRIPGVVVTAGAPAA